MTLTANHIADKLAELREIDAVLVRLESVADDNRRRRANGMHVRGMHRDGHRITGTVAGRTGLYECRITLSPRGFHCTCPDARGRGRQVGPCKHVLALGRTYRQDAVQPAIQRLETEQAILLGIDDIPF